MSSTGWAVKCDGSIDVRTVSPERRGALVNWLVVTTGVMIYDYATDDDIEFLWRDNKGDASVVPVTITEG